MPIQLTGENKEKSQMLKIKDNVDHVGPSQPLVQLKPPMLSLDQDQSPPDLNNN